MERWGARGKKNGRRVWERGFDVDGDRFGLDVLNLNDQLDLSGQGDYEQNRRRGLDRDMSALLRTARQLAADVAIGDLNLSKLNICDPLHVARSLRWTGERRAGLAWLAVRQHPGLDAGVHLPQGEQQYEDGTTQKPHER